MDPVSSSEKPDAGAGRDDVVEALHDARKAQRLWAAVPIQDRARIVKQVRQHVAERAAEFAEASAHLRSRPVEEMLTAEVLPLLEAHRFAEKSAGAVLSVRELGSKGRPAWLSSVSTRVSREPRGVVLLVGPRNYPLLLPGVQVLQALVAGNAVLVKPGAGCSDVMRKLAAAWREARLPRHLLQILPEEPDAVHRAIAAGVDFVVLTGSVASGQAVYRACAEKLVPATMELSGSDCVIVREDADLKLVSDALAFGLRLNAGETCIAPRRVFVARRIGERLEAELANALESSPQYPAPETLVPKLNRVLAGAAERGGTVVAGGPQGDTLMLPLVISGRSNVVELLDEEIFGSVLVMTFVDTDEEAVMLARKSPYALGATVFSTNIEAARQIADAVKAGVVVINDMIVPTADPRLPFGGSGRSGFGVTRGVEGLLEMTVPKVVSVTAGRRRPHFKPLERGARNILTGYIELIHGRWRNRWSALKRLFSGVRELQSHPSSPDLSKHHEQ